MSICFATPAYGHQMFLACHLSYLALQRDLLEAKVPHDFITTGNESLVTRARNTTVGTYRNDLRFAEYQRLMFIDADIEFTTDAVGKLWHLDADVIVGAYPMKTPDRLPTTIWKNGKVVELSSLRVGCKLDEVSPTPVDYTGTGFMMIKREVFDQLEKAHPEWIVEDGGGHEYCCFFQAPPEDRMELSEDYFFCKRWRELGGEVLVDPSIVLHHWGTFRYGE